MLVSRSLVAIPLVLLCACSGSNNNDNSSSYPLIPSVEESSSEPVDTSVDHQPVAVADSFSGSVNIPITGNVLSNDSGLEDSVATVVVSSDVSHGSVAMTNTGDFTYTPSTGFSGSDSFTYTVTDADGDSSSATVSLTIAAPDHQPVAVADSVSGSANTLLTGNVLGNDSGLEDSVATVVVSSDVSHGSVAMTNSGDFTYTPDTDFSGSDSFTYTVTDTDGDSSSATVSLTIAAIDHQPVAVADSVSGSANTPLTGNVLGNDSGLEDSVATVVVSSDVSHGSVAMANSGDFTYTPDTDFSGSDSFTYTVTDADGDSSSATVSLTIAACTATENGGAVASGVVTTLVNNDFISFEQASVPDEWVATKGSLSIYDGRAKHGSRSLQWDWLCGDQLKVSNITSLGFDGNKINGYYNNPFRLWLYNESAEANKVLKVEFYDINDVLQYHYDVSLNFTGWRAATVAYKTDMAGDKLNQSLSYVIMRAPGVGSGRLFFDYIDFVTTPIKYPGADYQVPMVETYNHWVDQLRYQSFSKTIAATIPTGVELADAATIKTDYMNSINGRAPKVDVLATANAEFAKLNIRFENGVLKADKILFGYDEPTWGIDTYVIDNKIILPLVQDYRFNGSEQSKNNFLDLIRYMLDQGYAEGSNLETVHHIGYIFRNISTAIMLMEAELREAGLWAQAYGMLEWYNAVDQIWDPASNSNTDYALTRMKYILGTILLQEDAAKRVQYLKAYAQAVGSWLTQYSRGGEGAKPDYSVFHHNTHYPGYYYGAIEVLAYVSRLLGGTEFAVASDKLALLRKILLAARVHHADRPLALSMSGRNPFDQPRFNQGLLNLGYALDDNGLFAAHNRVYGANYYGSDATTKAVAAETSPEGFWQFNYRPMGVYRQGDWVANIKGFNRMLWGSEIYSSENRYGRYQSYGSVLIHYEGKGESGMEKAGWDWNVVPGATTKHLTDAQLVAEYSRQDETTDTRFAGALRFGSKNTVYLDPALEGEFGVFGFDFRQKNLSSSHDSSFTFRKSVFAYQGHLICLGSGINSDDTVNKVSTNLFQVSSALGALYEDGVEHSSSSYSQSLAAGAADHWLIDPAGTGYYLPAGQAVEILADSQSSLSETGDGSTTVANYAKAWIDHGATPTAAGYEYIIRPGSNSTQMQALATQMQGASPLYKVLQRDADAHVLEFSAEAMEGYAIFTAATGIQGNYITATDTPVLAMVRQAAGQLQLSLANPDLDFVEVSTGKWEGDAQVMRVSLTLKGAWQYASGDALVDISTIGGETTIVVDTRDGAAIDVVLNPL